MKTPYGNRAQNSSSAKYMNQTTLNSVGLSCGASVIARMRCVVKASFFALDHQQERPAAPEVLSGVFAIACHCLGPDANLRQRFVSRLSVLIRMTPPAPRCLNDQSIIQTRTATMGNIINVHQRDNQEYHRKRKWSKLRRINLRLSYSALPGREARPVLRKCWDQGWQKPHSIGKGQGGVALWSQC